MPDQDDGEVPPANPDKEPSAIGPRPPVPQQGIMASAGTANSQENAEGTKKLAADVHWITHATFWSQIGLGLIGVVALWIYYGQLCEMRKATVASAESADAAKRASELATNTFYLTYRPRVKIFPGGEQQDAIVRNKVLTVSIDASNLGPFDARNVRFFRYENISTRDVVTQMPYEEFPSHRLIPPKAEGKFSGEMIVTGTRKLTPIEFAGLKTGRLWATFSIKITYDDDFGHVHHAEYCRLFTLRPEYDICPWPVQND